MSLDEGDGNAKPLTSTAEPSVSELKSKPTSTKSQMLKAAGAMGSATFLSRILGLVREEVFAFLFGASNETDAFNVAFRLPNLLRDLFAEGAMSAALIPTFTEVRKREGDRRAWRMAGLVFRSLFAIVGVLSFFGILFAPQLVELYAHAYHAVPHKFELTVQMTRIMFPFFPLVALAAAFMGILNACGKFFLPAFASALFNLSSIIVGVILAFVFPHFGYSPILGMAIGVLIGGAVQALCQLPTLYRSGYQWSPRLETEVVWYREPALKKMLMLMIPGTIGLGATQVNVLVNTILATSQQPGAVSWLNYAFRLMQFPIGVFGVSLGYATLTQLSRLWVDEDMEGLKETLTESLNHVIAINLPASAGLAFLGFPIVQLLFQYGHFKATDSASTAQALAAYAVGLTAYSAVKVLVPACYALGNTKVAVLSSVLSVFFTITLNLCLIGPLGFKGLALGTSIAAIFNAVFLLYCVKNLLKKKNGNLPLTPLLKTLLAYLGCALLMGSLCYLSYQFLEGFINEEVLKGIFGKIGIPLVRGFRVGLVTLEGVGIIWVLASLFKLQEITEVSHSVRQKIRQKIDRQFRKKG